VGFVKGETGYCSETCVTGSVGGTGEGNIKLEEAVHIKEEAGIELEEAIDIEEEAGMDLEEAIDIKEEVSIKVEDNIHIKDETPEAITYPPVNTEHEVRFWVGCEVGASDAFRSFVATKRKLLNYS
jgi:hypothetical protein